jgi:hypothetical protein
MGQDSDRALFYNAMTTGWTITPQTGQPYLRTPIRYDSVRSGDDVTTGVVPWLRCYMSYGTATQSSLGTNKVLYRWGGCLFVIEIYSKEENGDAPILQIADLIKPIFIGKSYLVSQTESIRVVDISLHNRNPFKGWISKSVTIGYEKDEVIERT